MPARRGISAVPKKENTFERKSARQRSSLRKRYAEGEDGLSGEELKKKVDTELKKWKRTVAVKAEKENVKTEVNGEQKCKGEVDTEVKGEKKCKDDVKTKVKGEKKCKGGVKTEGKGEVMAQPVEASTFDVSPVMMAISVEAPMSDVESPGPASPGPTLRDPSSSPEKTASPHLAIKDRSRSPVRTQPVQHSVCPGCVIIEVKKDWTHWNFRAINNGVSKEARFFPNLVLFPGSLDLENRRQYQGYRIVGVAGSRFDHPVACTNENSFWVLAPMAPTALLWLEPPPEKQPKVPSFLANSTDDEIAEYHRRVTENKHFNMRKHPLRVQTRQA